MNIFWQVLYLALWLLRWVLLARIVFDVVRIFAKTWRPSGAAAVLLELLYAITDPPIRLLRRIIPPIRIGGGGFDLSVMVLLIVLMIAMPIVAGAAMRSL